MSLFYNVKINGGTTITAENDKNNKNENPCEFRTTRTDIILEKQSDYQVGVCRFKLPSKNIPMFKVGNLGRGGANVFENLPYYMMFMFYCGITPNTAGFRNDAPQNGHIYKSQPAYLNGDGLAYRLSTINSASKQTEQTAVAPPKKIWNSGITINTEDEWVDYMNAMCMNAMSGLRYTFQQNNSIGATNVAGNQLTINYGRGDIAGFPRAGESTTRPLYNFRPQNYTMIVPELRQGQSWNFEFVYPTASATIPSRLVYNFVARLSNIKLNTGGRTRDISLRLFSPADGTGKREMWYILNGFGGASQSEFRNNLYISPMFPMNAQTLVGNKRTDGLSQFPEQFIGGASQNILVKPFVEDYKEFFKGIKADGTGGWLIEVKNNGRGVIEGGFNMELSLFDEIQGDIANVCRASPFAGLDTPSFSYDNDNGLLNYNIDSDYFIPKTTNTGIFPPAPNQIVEPLRMGFECFMNYNLQGLFNFSFQQIPPSYSNPSSWDLTNQGSAFRGKFIDPCDNQGSIILIPSQDIDMGAGGGKKLIINEFQSSAYLRRNLHSFLISSNTLSVKGELLSDSNQSRKVLTDFEINPDDNQTYIQYFSQGYMRYYPLESNLPLREMGLKVYYETSLGEIFPLTIPNGSIATIKLEFRPNNMIFTQ